MIKLDWDTEYKTYSYSAVGVNPKTKSIDNEYGVGVARSTHEAKGLAMDKFKDSRGYDCGSVDVLILNLEELGKLVCLSHPDTN